MARASSSRLWVPLVGFIFNHMAHAIVAVTKFLERGLETFRSLPLNLGQSEGPIAPQAYRPRHVLGNQIPTRDLGVGEVACPATR